MRAEDLDQSLVFGAVLLEALELEARRAEGAGGRVAQAADGLRGTRALTSIRSSVEGADDAVAAGDTPCRCACDGRRAVSMTPAAEALMTAETPPDWA